MIVLLLILILLLGTLAFGLSPMATNEWESHWLVVSGLGLCLTATSIGNPWIALIFTWIGLHPFVQWVGVQRGILRAGVTPARQIEQMVTAWAYAGLYVLFQDRLPSGALWWVAVATVAWAHVAACVDLGQGPVARRGMWATIWAHPDRPYGFLGGPHIFSFVMSMGVLGGMYLLWAGSPWAALLLPMPIYGFTRARNLSAPAALVPAACAFLALVHLGWATLFPLLVILLAALCLSYGTAKQSLAQRWPAWKNVWTLGWTTHWWGTGLGTIANTVEIQVTGPQVVARRWCPLHNDWLQTAFELGPVPVLMALIWYGTTAWTLPATPEAAYAFAGMIFLGLYAVTYYPVREPTQALLAVLWAAVLG